jgi:predicted aspartyl protease
MGVGISQDHLIIFICFHRSDVIRLALFQPKVTTIWLISWRKNRLIFVENEYMASLKKFLLKKNYTKVPLVLTATNHFEIVAKINGITGRFILDTGASNTCIGFDKLEFFNLNSKETKIKAAGAGATNMETLISTKNKIEIGDWKKSKLKIVLFDLVHVNEALTSHEALPVDGIIGADVLKKAKAIIDYDKRYIYLKNRK